MTYRVKPRCGAPVRDQKAGEMSTCGRVVGHTRDHRSLAAEARKLERTRHWKANPDNRATAYEASRRWYAANPERVRDLGRKHTQRKRDTAREEFLALYGRVCACCSTTENLTIDHVNGDGGEHRAQYGNGGYNYLVYRDAVAEFPSDRYQTLCKPCNSSKKSGERCHLDHSTRTSP